MNYTRLEYNLDEIADKGRGSIKYRVFGYRGSEAVELEINRRDRNNQLWTITPTRSGYVSREEDQEPNDLTAMENTVAALKDAIALGREIEKDIPRLEARFQTADAVIQDFNISDQALFSIVVNRHYVDAAINRKYFFNDLLWCTLISFFSITSQLLCYRLIAGEGSITFKASMSSILLYSPNLMQLFNHTSIIHSTCRKSKWNFWLTF